MEKEVKVKKAKASKIKKAASKAKKVVPIVKKAQPKIAAGKFKVYLAGPLFTKYEIAARKAEHKLFKKTFPTIKTFAPIDAPFNETGRPTNRMIFQTDFDEMITSNIFIFDLNNMDEGTLVELGIAIERARNDKSIEIYGFLWDLRQHRGEGKGPFDKPWGVNAFLIGGIETYGVIVPTFEDVLVEMKKKGH